MSDKQKYTLTMISLPTPLSINSKIRNKKNHIQQQSNYASMIFKAPLKNSQLLFCTVVFSSFLVYVLKFIITDYYYITKMDFVTIKI